MQNLASKVNVDNGYHRNVVRIKIHPLFFWGGGGYVSDEGAGHERGDKVVAQPNTLTTATLLRQPCILPDIFLACYLLQQSKPTA